MNLKYRWVACFKDKMIKQPADDRYSKHNPDREWNPSSFRDFQDYFDEHPEDLQQFSLWSDNDAYFIDFSREGHPVIKQIRKGKNWACDKEVILSREKRRLSDIRIIYYRKMEMQIKNGLASSPKVVGYVLGYQGLDDNGNNRQKIITVI